MSTHTTYEKGDGKGGKDRWEEGRIMYGFDDVYQCKAH